MNADRRTFLTCLVCAAAGSASGWPAGAQSLTRVEVGILPPSDIAAEPYYAQAQGFFRRAGLDIGIEPLANGPALVTAVASGHLDIAYSNVLSIATARERGIEMVVLAPANLHVHSAPTAGILVVKKSAPIFSAKDLAGRTIAVEGINSIVAISTKAWVDANGGDSKSVNFVELSLSASVPAILAGRVDAAGIDAIHDPTTGHAGDQLRHLCSSTLDAISPNFAPSVWFATPQWVATHRDAAAAFVRVMTETAAWANSHRSDSAKILASFTNQSPDDIQRVTRVTYGTKLTPAMIQAPIDTAAKYGLIKASFPAAEMIATIR